MNTIGVGVAVIIQKGDFILLGKRKSAHGEGSWSFPGGSLDYGETFEACARREVLEETGLYIDAVRQGPTTNNLFPDKVHSVTVFMVAEYGAGTPENIEPEKCEGWEWFSWTALPQPLFLPVRLLIEQFIALQKAEQQQ